MPGIPLPRAISVAQFAPPPSEQTYTQVFNETMGNAGTPDDGFDQDFAAITALTDSVSPIADFDPADLEAFSSVINLFGAGEGAALAVTYQSASDATDAALGTYVGLTQPSTDPTQPVPPTGSNPPPTTSDDCINIPKGVAVVKLPPMNVGDAPLTVEVDSEQYSSRDGNEFRIEMHCGDAGVFSTQSVKVLIGRGTGGGGNFFVYEAKYNLVVTPSKAGKFVGVVTEYDNAVNADTTYFYYSVEIT
jgi:hypothetical protein